MVEQLSVKPLSQKLAGNRKTIDSIIGWKTLRRKWIQQKSRLESHDLLRGPLP